MPLRKLPPNAEVIALYRSGVSCPEIAERFNVAPVTVTSLLRRIGEPRRSAAEAARIRGEQGRAVQPSYWSGKKQPADMVERRVSKIRGEQHYLWKGGVDRRAYRGVVEKVACRDCGGKLNLAIHHENYDHYDDRPENLIVLCVSCHSRTHKQAYWDAVHAGKEPPKSNAPIHWRKAE